MRRFILLLVLVGTTACIKERIIQKKTEEAFQSATPLRSQTPLPKEAPAPEKFPHEIWDQVLQEFVDERGFVNYQALLKNRTNVDLYAAYVNQFSPETNPSLFPAREDQLTYYINAFNLSTFLLVLDRYPIKNIYDMRADFFVETVFILGGKKFTLNSLETMLRKQYQEPRVHFLLNCAARGDPRLPRKAFFPETLEESFEKEATFYLSEERNVKIVDEKTVELSSMFDLYGDDFGEDLIGYINKYRPEGKKLPAKARIKFVPYNWVPNDQAIP